MGGLGRGLFKIELFWILGMLGQLGVIRFDDLGAVTALPHRLVRDTLFRLGFVASPYAPDAPTLLAAARAARRAAGGEPADEIVARFALAAGCAYDCPHRKACDFPCREREHQHAWSIGYSRRSRQGKSQAFRCGQS